MITARQAGHGEIRWFS